MDKQLLLLLPKMLQRKWKFKKSRHNTYVHAPI